MGSVRDHDDEQVEAAHQQALGGQQEQGCARSARLRDADGVHQRASVATRLPAARPPLRPVAGRRQATRSQRSPRTRGTTRKSRRSTSTRRSPLGRSALPHCRANPADTCARVMLRASGVRAGSSAQIDGRLVTIAVAATTAAAYVSQHRRTLPTAQGHRGQADRLNHHAPSEEGPGVKLGEQAAGPKRGKRRRHQRRDEHCARFSHAAAMVGVDGDRNPGAVLAGLEAAKYEGQAAQTFHADQVRANRTRRRVASAIDLRRDRLQSAAPATSATAPAARGPRHWSIGRRSATCSTRRGSVAALRANRPRPCRERRRHRSSRTPRGPRGSPAGRVRTSSIAPCAISRVTKAWTPSPAATRSMSGP